MSSPSSVVQCCFKSGSGTVKSIFLYLALSYYKLEAKFRGVVDISLVGCPFVVHHKFGIMTEEVDNSL